MGKRLLDGDSRGVTKMTNLTDTIKAWLLGRDDWQTFVVFAIGLTLTCFLLWVLICVLYAFVVWEPVYIWWPGARTAAVVGFVAAIWVILLEANDE